VGFSSRHGEESIGFSAPKESPVGKCKTAGMKVYVVDKIKKGIYIS